MNVLEDVDNVTVSVVTGDGHDVTDCMINDENLVENDVDQNKWLLMALETDLHEAKLKLNKIIIKFSLKNFSILHFVLDILWQ